MKKIIHAVTIHAPPDEVFRALTTQEGLAGWWSTEVRVEEGEGGLADFTFIEGFNPDMRVTELLQNRRVGWLCEAGHDNWLDNRFWFELEGEGGDTLLLFTQDYSRELDDRTYGTYNYNWGYYLGSLKRLCEEGEGAPFQP